jgi:hypothetical protein
VWFDSCNQIFLELLTAGRDEHVLKRDAAQEILRAFQGRGNSVNARFAKFSRRTFNAGLITRSTNVSTSIGAAVISSISLRNATICCSSFAGSLLAMLGGLTFV